MASDNIFNRMYLTTNNVLYEIDKESRMQDLVNLYKQRLSNRLVNTSQSCMIYDAACLGLTRDADHNQIVHGFIEYAIICHQNVIPDNVGPGSVLGGVLGEIGPEYPRALDLKTQKYNVLFLNPFWNPYDQGPFPLADLIHDSDPRADLMGKPNQINKKTGGAARLGGWGYINIMNNKWGGSRPFLRKAVINSSIRPIVISHEDCFDEISRDFFVKSGKKDKWEDINPSTASTLISPLNTNVRIMNNIEIPRIASVDYPDQLAYADSLGIQEVKNARKNSELQEITTDKRCDHIRNFMGLDAAQHVLYVGDCAGPTTGDAAILCRTNVGPIPIEPFLGNGLNSENITGGGKLLQSVAGGTMECGE